MAANFWLSSHCNQWLLDREEIELERQRDYQNLKDDDYKKIQIFYINFMQALGEHLKLRQQVIATATLYYKRFYARNSLKSIDPLLMAPTCTYLAHKTEECGVISNTRFTAACNAVVKNKFSFAFPGDQFPYRMTQVKLNLHRNEVMLTTLHFTRAFNELRLLSSSRRAWVLECEFFLLEMMDCCLIVYHPYRPLTQYVADLGMEDAILPIAWRILNDSLRTDVSLIYPPYQIALAAIYMACVIQQKDSKQWFAELSVDMDKILEITQEILQLYELLKSYDERTEISTILSRAPRPKVRPTSATPGQTPSPVPPES